jgi:hypothetical protein
VLWTSLNLREAWVLLGFGLVGLGAARWFSAHQRGALVVAGAGVALVGFGRSWILFVAAVGLAAGWLVSLRRRPAHALVMGGVLGAMTWMLFVAGIADRYLLVLDEAGVQGIREQTAIGSSALVPTAGGVPGLMLGLVNATLRPLPWDAVEGLRQLLAMPETLIWYALLVIGVRGAWGVRHRHPEIVFPMLGAAGAVFVAIALLESNEGLIYRHRLPAVAVVVTFAVGWLAAGRRPTEAPTGPHPGPDPG